MRTSIFRPQGLLLAALSLSHLTSSLIAPFGTVPHDAVKKSADSAPKPQGVARPHAFVASTKEDGGNNDSNSTICIELTVEVDVFYYRNDYPWSGTGSYTAGTHQHCVPKSNAAGGAMFIGLTPNPQPGTTKFEANFPLTDPYGWYDMSIVDGYSLSMTCNASGAIVGGDINLWDQGNSCFNHDLQQGICRNDHSYDGPDGTHVTQFFKAGSQNGQEYCNYVNCPVPRFPMDGGVACTVSGSLPKNATGTCFA